MFGGGEEKRILETRADAGETSHTFWDAAGCGVVTFYLFRSLIYGFLLKVKAKSLSEWIFISFHFGKQSAPGVFS
jgi:hypothetical protein